MAKEKRPLDEVDEGDSSPTHKRRRMAGPLSSPSPPPGPWHEGDFYLKRFELQELHANQVIDLPTAHLGDLCNPIHPLFFSLQRFTHLRPALRLATKFIEEPSLLPYWHGLIFSTYHYLPFTSRRLNAPCYSFSQRPGPLTVPQLERVRQGMLYAARTTSFEFVESSGIDAWAVCVRSSATALRPFPGTGSIIRLSKAFLTVLHPATTLSNPQRLRTSLLLANTLAHEFAHAARNARMKPPQSPIEDFEPFFYDQRRAEVGHAWESVVLGGRIFPFLNAYDSRFGMCVEKWPDLDEKYMVVRPNKPPIPISRKPPKKWTTMYAMPMPFVQSLFTQAFWDREVGVCGLKALRFEKRLGLRIRNWDWTGDSDGVPTDDSSRCRWPDEDGIVRPGQPVRLSPNLEAMDLDDESDEKDGEMEIALETGPD